MKRIQRVDLIHGPILPAILSFAFPILLSNIFQQLYNASDVMIVGHFLGSKSLAAVGSTAAIFDLIIGFALGVGNGMGIIIARNYGANRFDQLRKSVAATAVIGGDLSLVVMLLGYFGLYPLLEFLGTPSSIIGQAYLYISTIVNCVAVTFAYNLCAGLLRAVGDSLAALYFLMIAAVLNIFLDLYFITQLHWGVQSAGIATIIAQGISALLCLLYIRKKVPFLLPHRKDFIWDKELYQDLLSQGLAMGLMTSIVSIGTVILQSAINQLGTTIISAQVAARRIMSFAVLPITAIASSITTFISQNFGAEQFQRIKKGITITNLLSWGWSVLVAALLFFTSPSLTSFISGSSNPDLIANASLYLQISSCFYPILASLIILRNALQGMGKKLTPLTSSFIELFGKIFFVVFIIPYTGYMGVIFCEPLIWIPMTLQLIVTYRKIRYQLLA